MNTPMSSELLVWGADPSDNTPLFENGPPAGPFRTRLRDSLIALYDSSAEPVRVIFSEDGETFGHNPQNPGLYEPLQAKRAEFILLIFPGNRPMAVNTWELALACEDPASGEKLGFVVPASVFQYLQVLFSEAPSDPAGFEWPSHLGDEPVLGPQNSFAVRWIYLFARDRFATSGQAGDPGTFVRLHHYDDQVDWHSDPATQDVVLGEICVFVDSNRRTT